MQREQCVWVGPGGVRYSVRSRVCGSVVSVRLYPPGTTFDRVLHHSRSGRPERC